MSCGSQTAVSFKSLGSHKTNVGAVQMAHFHFQTNINKLRSIEVKLKKRRPGCVQAAKYNGLPLAGSLFSLKRGLR
jgi:hypothetical protein